MWVNGRLIPVQTPAILVATILDFLIITHTLRPQQSSQDWTVLVLPVFPTPHLLNPFPCTFWNSKWSISRITFIFITYMKIHSAFLPQLSPNNTLSEVPVSRASCPRDNLIAIFQRHLAHSLSVLPTTVPSTWNAFPCFTLHIHRTMSFTSVK